MTRISRGIPRLINAVADRALLAAYTEGRRQVDARLVRRAARELPATEFSGFRELTGLRVGIALGLVAAGLIFGELTADHYADAVAADPRIDLLRERMEVLEEPRYSRDYLDPEKRSIANGLSVELTDGTRLPEVLVEYPIGHRRRRKEGMPMLVEKFKTNLARRFPAKQQKAILDSSLDQSKLESMAVNEYVDLFVI